MILLASIALASPSRWEVSFNEGLLITGFPPTESGPGCGVRFEYEDPARGWSYYRFGLTAPEGPGEGDGDWPYAFLPPHGWREASHWSWLALGQAGQGYNWRVAAGDGTVLTEFDGVYAINALPLALALGVEETYSRAKSDPDCVSINGSECWTALELWLFLEDWQDQYCVVE